MEKKGKKAVIILVSIVCICLMIFITSIVARIRSSKGESEMSSSNSIQSELDQTNVDSSNDINKSIVDTHSIVETDSDDVEVLKPIDCNGDFWAVKVGIAECYDHMFKKGHMTGTTYYQGDCTNHDPKEIQELAKQVKLLRDDDENGGVFYTATLPESGWVVTIYDSKIWEIIDAQIEESGPAYNEEISIVMYYFDNALYIEVSEE